MSVFFRSVRPRGVIQATGVLLTSAVLGGAFVGARMPQAAAAAPGPVSAASPVRKVSIRKMSGLRIAATIKTGKVADWVVVTSDGVWTGSKKPNAVKRIDPETNTVTSTVGLPGEPCAGLASDSQNLWVPLCGSTPKLAKINLKTRALVQVFDVGPAGPEGGVATGAGSVWLVTDKQGSLARIDPASGAVLQTVRVAPGSYNPVFSDGRIWVTRAEGSEVTSVDAATGKVLEHIDTGTGRHPRFVTAGGGAVWALNQGDGTLTRIDTSGGREVLTLPLHTPGSGGDITYAEGRIWTTVMKTPLSVTDAVNPAILCQWTGAGGDAIGVGYDSIWLTNYDAGTVSRILLSDLPEDCRVAK